MNKFVPETISNRQDLPTLLGDPLQRSLTERHLNSAFMRVGAYPATRADINADGVQNGESTNELKQLIEQNQRLAQELERKNIPNKFARTDLWNGKNNKLGSAVVVDEDDDGGPFSSTGACVRVCVRTCMPARMCVCVRAWALAPPPPSHAAKNTVRCCAYVQAESGSGRVHVRSPRISCSMGCARR